MAPAASKATASQIASFGGAMPGLERGLIELI
jgi:hypothetical protein